MAKTNATQRTLKELRDQGWNCCIVERYMNHPGMKFPRRVDAFNIGDLLACRPGVVLEGVYEPPCIALVQCFPDSGGNAGFDAHREKILANKETGIWLRAGGKIFLYGWKLRGKKGRKRWEWKREEVVFGA